MMPLAMLKSGEKARVKAIRGGRGFVSRISAMGLTPGTEIQVITSQGHGPMVVKVRENRLALGHGMAHRVMVE